MSPTPRTTALFEKQDTATDCTNQDRWEEMAVHAHELETELARLRADLARFTGDGLLDCHAICDQRDTAVAERDRLRADAAEMSAQRSHQASSILLRQGG